MPLLVNSCLVSKAKSVTVIDWTRRGTALAAAEEVGSEKTKDWKALSMNQCAGGTDDAAEDGLALRWREKVTP